MTGSPRGPPPGRGTPPGYRSPPRRRTARPAGCGLQVEAALIGSDAIPALHETPTTLVAAGLSWIGCRDGDGLLGAAAITETTEIVELDRLVVAPRAFRRGIGGRLLAAVVAFAEHRSVVVSTGRDNVPARALYARAGFRETGEREVLPRLWIVSYTLDGSGLTSPGTGITHPGTD